MDPLVINLSLTCQVFVPFTSPFNSAALLYDDQVMGMVQAKLYQ
jgi:hypothetical protein